LGIYDLLFKNLFLKFPKAISLKKIFFLILGDPFISKGSYLSVLAKIFTLFLFFFVLLGLKLRTYTLNHFTSPPAFFVVGVFEIGSHELFAQAGFELQSS
jgi:hypothetical protein